MEDFHRKPKGSWEGKAYLLIPSKIRPEWIWVVRLTQLDLSKITNVLQSDHYRLDTARNMLVEKALEIDAQMVIFMDTDILPPPQGINRLLTVQYPIVSGFYYTSGPNTLPCAWAWEKKEIDGKEIEAYFHIPSNATGFVRADAVGMGFVKIDVDIFKRLDPPWFLYEERYEGRRRVEGISEDFYFFRKVREQIGCGVALDADLRCQHLRMGIIDDKGNYEVSTSKALEKI